MKKPPGKTEPSAPPDVDRRSMDSVMRDVSKLLSSREFDSIDDVNTFLQHAIVGGRVPTAAPETPLERAQDLMYEAFEQKLPARRVALARKALAESEDCADAYVLLAQEEPMTPREDVAMLAKGVAAGERALGKKLDEFVESGSMWGVIETRPYMRARAAHAVALWDIGDRQAAIANAADMLRMNPGDNQGMRHVLLGWLLRAGSNDDVEKLLSQVDEDTAMCTYSRALFVFRTQGIGATSNDALRKAFHANPHVPPYLLGEMRLPRQLPGYVGFGDDSEAAVYVDDALSVWSDTPGAMYWLADRWSKRGPAKTSSSKPRSSKKR